MIIAKYVKVCLLDSWAIKFIAMHKKIKAHQRDRNPSAPRWSEAQLRKIQKSDVKTSVPRVHFVHLGALFEPPVLSLRSPSLIQEDS